MEARINWFPFRRKLFKMLGLLVAFNFILEISCATILDPKANNSFLRKLAAALDLKGIDVMQSWQSEVATNDKPVLAPLAGYKVTGIASSEWGNELEKGLSEAIFAAPGKGDNLAKFRSAWDSHPEQRIFISFAREDYAHAMAVKEILAQAGYTAFTYLSDDKAPVFLTDQIAYYLHSASTHLVFDTKTARNKEGVVAEALAYAKYYSPEIITENRQLEQKLSTALLNKDVPVPAYEDLVKRFKLYYLADSLTDEQVKERMKDRFNIKDDNLTDFIKKGVEQRALDLADNMHFYQQQAPATYNSWLKTTVNAFGEASPFICPRCHLPYSFPFCLPMLPVVPLLILEGL